MDLLSICANKRYCKKQAGDDEADITMFYANQFSIRNIDYNGERATMRSSLVNRNTSMIRPSIRDRPKVAIPRYSSPRWTLEDWTVNTTERGRSFYCLVMYVHENIMFMETLTYKYK